jgi:hypothetical protein
MGFGTVLAICMQVRDDFRSSVMSDSGGRNLSQKLETFSGCTENDYLCLVMKLLLEVENYVGIKK